VFILYSLVIGLALGLLFGGRASGLADLRIRWQWAMAVGLVTQVLLFSTPLADQVGSWGPLIYVSSTALVLVAIVANWRIAGMPVVAAGALSNLAAIVANGGYMPADLGAMASLGRVSIDGYSNSALLADPALKPLTDIFALPTWLPFTNVFSIGDVLIGIGVAIVIVAAMLSTRAPDAGPQLGARTH
jgi:lipoprotein signal peptidase